ncbi:MAG: hypothetical protein NC909_00195 [Candidatus Omnitrophica bacterium]|nr:hypothetical protein [Candidatus Omnitrophota bacterium]
MVFIFIKIKMILKKFLKTKIKKAQSIIEYLILFSVLILIFTLGAKGFLENLSKSSDNFFQGAAKKIVGETEQDYGGGYFEPPPEDYNTIGNINEIN